jgi:hypothetical protein
MALRKSSLYLTGGNNRRAHLCILEVAAGFCLQFPHPIPHPRHRLMQARPERLFFKAA